MYASQIVNAIFNLMAVFTRALLARTQAFSMISHLSATCS
jgi:hypothetical protein